MTTCAAIATAILVAGPFAPEDSLDHVQLAPGFEIRLVAAEPDVFDPVACALDENGHLYVVENRGYPDDDAQRGTIALLTDPDGDGRFTRKSTFAEGLDFPNGVMVWNGGILVTDAPRLLYLKDTNGNGVADVREAWLEGFSLGGSTQLRVSHPTLGLDNWIHLANGLSGGDVRVTTLPGDDTFTMGAHDLRYNPFTGALESVGGRAQFGLAFDGFGEKFVCSNRNHVQHVMLNPADLARNPALGATETALDSSAHGAAARVFPLTAARTTAYAHAGTFTAACGLVATPWGSDQDSAGSTLVCEPTGNLVHRDVLEATGPTFTARRAREGVEFLASTDDWFRPVFLTHGPGDSLFLCDMYRATIEHPTYLPPNVAEDTDFGAGRDRGRIYRIHPSDNDNEPENWESTEGLLDGLGNGPWSRETARRLLLEKQGPSAIPPLRRALHSEPNPSVRIAALSLLDGLGVLSADDLRAALIDTHPRVRKFAVRLARAHKDVPFPGDIAGDPDPAVRFEAALALGDRAATPVDALAKIAAQAPGDTWTRAAVLSGIHPNVAPFARAYLTASDAPDPALMGDLGAMLAQTATADAAIATLTNALEIDAPASESWQPALLAGYLGHGRVDNLDALSDLVSPRAAETLATLTQRAVARLGDTAGDVAARVQAAELLAFASPAEVASTLGSLLTPATPAPIQEAAINALFHASSEAAITAVLKPATWNAFTDPVRSAALNELLRTTAGVEALLDALASERIATATIRPTYRARLVRARDEAQRQRAQALFPVVRQEDRMAVFEAKKPILELDGNPIAGKAVFENLCSRCHTYGDSGHGVGPDLTGIGSQPRDAILMHILAPNWLLLPGYENYVVTTKNFEEFSGIIANETETSITIRAPFGLDHTIPRADIDTLEMTSLSMMPEAFEDAMTDGELRDLVEFLKTGE